MAGKPIPRPSFLDQCVLLGAFNGQKRWRSQDFKRIYTWDSFHGEIEVFNKRGKHLGVYNINGELIKLPINGRKIDV